MYFLSCMTYLGQHIVFFNADALYCVQVLRQLNAGAFTYHVDSLYRIDCVVQSVYITVDSVWVHAILDQPWMHSTKLNPRSLVHSILYIPGIVVKHKKEKAISM